jgi:hypothetical protein
MMTLSDSRHLILQEAKIRKPMQVPFHTKKKTEVRKTIKSQIRFAMNHLFKNENVGGR